MSAAYLRIRESSWMPATGRCDAEFDIRNDIGRNLARRGRLRHRLSPLRRRDRHADRGWRARALRSATCAPGEAAPRASGFRRCRRKTAATRCCSRPCARTSAGITSRAGRFCWWKPHAATASPALERVRVATPPDLRPRARLCAPSAAPWSIRCCTIWRNRSLIRVMVRRDILGRYRGSFGGSFWTVINPLLLMLTYFFVFGVVLQSRFPGDPSRAGFALYFLAGMLPWLAFSEARRARAHGDAGASQFRQEAGLRGGDAARQPGGLGPGERIVRRDPVLRCSCWCCGTACRRRCCGCRCC